MTVMACTGPVCRCKADYFLHSNIFTSPQNSQTAREGWIKFTDWDLEKVADNQNIFRCFQWQSLEWVHLFERVASRNLARSVVQLPTFQRKNKLLSIFASLSSALIASGKKKTKISAVERNVLVLLQEVQEASIAGTNRFLSGLIKWIHF